MRLLRTVYPLSLRQILTRIANVARRRLWQIAGTKCPLDQSPPAYRYISIWAGLGELHQNLQGTSSVKRELEEARNIAMGRFLFLGRSVEFPEVVHWHLKCESQLWRYHLHYFGYLRSLVVADYAERRLWKASSDGPQLTATEYDGKRKNCSGKRAAPIKSYQELGGTIVRAHKSATNGLNESPAHGGSLSEALITPIDTDCMVSGPYMIFRRLVLGWIKGNLSLRGDGWHPYTISLRLVNWLNAAAAWEKELAGDPEFERAFWASTYAQAQLLWRQRELDVRGNHLLENLRALLWAGLVFKGSEAEKWFGGALSMLRVETDEQVLRDGGHFERTPGYVCVVLRAYLEIAILLERFAVECPEWVRDAVRRQALFLREILGPGQRLPLVKDTAFDAAPDPNELLNATAVWLRESRLKPDGKPGLETFLLFGGAANSQPDGVAARETRIVSRAFESSGFYVLKNGKGEHVLIDVGQPCPDYLPAHAHADSLNYEYHCAGNAVVVDSGVFEYASGAWRDYFRSTRAHNTVEVAGENSSEVWSSFRVGRKARVSVKHVEIEDAAARILAQHDGYRYLPGRPTHHRAFLWRAGQYLVVIDQVIGTGQQKFRSLVHFYPGITLEWTAPEACRIAGAGSPMWLHLVAAESRGEERGVVDPIPQGWYSERFGEKIPNWVLSLRPKPEFRDCVAYAFSPHLNFQCTLTAATEGIQIMILVEGAQESFHLSRQAFTKR